MSERTERQRLEPGGAGRRKFLGEMLRTACGVGLFGLGLGLYAQRSAALPSLRLRPPGALAESEFLGACIRCGLCVRACPYDILQLATPESELATGTPYFVARQLPCEMCPDIPCVPVCPTGALDHGLKDIDKARMGLAVLMDHETCIAFQGLRCEVCYQICPAKDQAITLERRHNERSGKHALFIPVVHSDHCTGCGKCEKSCILEEAAIKVLPLHIAKGELGHHYRLGWKEKEQAGHSLAPAEPEHRYTLPEGMHYEFGGRGLVVDPALSAPPAEMPPPEAHLEKLNMGGKP